MYNTHIPIGVYAYRERSLTMKKAMEKLETLLELGGTKKDIVFLILSGLALLVSIFRLLPLPFDAA